MNMEQAYRILASAGLPVQYKDNCLKESLPEYEHSYQLEKGDQWEYSEVNDEDQIIDHKKFSTEAEGIKYFVLNRLHSFYLKKYMKISPLAYEITSFSEFAERMEKLGIKNDHYSFSTIKPQSFLGTLEDNLVTINYINKEKNKGFVSSSLDFDRGLPILFNYVYLLHLLKKLEENLMDEQVIDKPFTDEYIRILIK